MIRFFVAGIPAGKGSFKAFMPKGGRTTPTITNDSKRTRPWEQAIRAEATVAGCNRLVGPVKIVATFVLPRPTGHLRTNGEIRPSAPMEPAKKPDLDKLLRALLDGLTGVAFHDDAQVTAAGVAKRYALPTEQPGVDVVIHASDAEESSVEAKR